ncbi:MAG: 4Fe-4S binding protein [Candidatus Promineifilaceae bacterium]
MYGLGIVKGMAVTMKHFIATYLDDIHWLARGGRYYNPEALSNRQSLNGKGVITVFYPEEKLAVPERFRFVPFLVTDDPKPGEQWPHDWCTSCGICAKVCPPQCIWIVRGKLPTGRPKPEPEQFYIDIDICMNCGLCAEFCPFDAIKMDHDYELASYDRSTAHIHDKERLSKPISYWHEIAQNKAAAEQAARDVALASKGRRRKRGEEETEELPILSAAQERQLPYKGVG